jgi:hypothetical protein
MSALTSASSPLTWSTSCAPPGAQHRAAAAVAEGGGTRPLRSLRATKGPEYRDPMDRSTDIRFKKVIVLRGHPQNNKLKHTAPTEMLNLGFCLRLFTVPRSGKINRPPSHMLILKNNPHYKQHVILC